MVELLWFLKMETLSDFIAVINESGELQMGPGIIIMTFKVSNINCDALVLQGYSS